MTVPALAKATTTMTTVKYKHLQKLTDDYCHTKNRVLLHTPLTPSTKQQQLGSGLELDFD